MVKAGIIDRFERNEHAKAIRRGQASVQHMRNLGVARIQGKRCRVLLRRYNAQGPLYWIVFGALGDVPAPHETVTKWYLS